MTSSDLKQTRDYIAKSKHYIKFSTKINKLMEFLNSLSWLLLDNGRIITCISGTKVHFMQAQLIDSAVKTLNSINYCCMFGSFGDANTLIRKYRDDLLLFLYIIDILNKRTYLNNKQIKEIVGDGIDVDKWVKVIELAFGNAINGSTKNDDDKCIDAWFENKMEMLSKKQKMKLGFENYMKHFKSNESIGEVIKTGNLERNWEDIRRKLNDFVHNNGFTYTQQNLVSKYSMETEIKNCLEETVARLEFITAVFMAFLILIDPSMIQSTDYLDSLECGLTPIDDSQYYVAPFIQAFIDEYINKINPKLKVFLKNNNKYGMLID